MSRPKPTAVLEMEWGFQIHCHYNIGRKEKQMKSLENLIDMLKALQEMVNIDNTNDSPFVEAYNLGVSAMRNQVEYYVKNVLMQKEGVQ